MKFKKYKENSYHCHVYFLKSLQVGMISSAASRQIISTNLNHRAFNTYSVSRERYQKKTSRKALINNADQLLSFSHKSHTRSIPAQNVFVFKNCSFQYKFCRKLGMHTTFFFVEKLKLSTKISMSSFRKFTYFTGFPKINPVTPKSTYKTTIFGYAYNI